MDDKKFTIEELSQHLETDVKGRMKDIAAEYEGREFPPEINDEFVALKDEREQTEKLIEELKERKAYLVTLDGEAAQVESESRYSFQTRKHNGAVPDDPTNIDEYRVRARNIDEYERALTDGAKKVLEGFRPSLQGADRETAQADIEGLLDNQDLARAEDGPRSLARRMIITSSPKYRSEFEQYIKTQGRVIGPMMERAASLTTTAGGFAVPVELDTTLLLTNAGRTNPVRQIARVRTTVANTVEFINTAGITAAYNAEATEASDNAPTLAQPTVNIEKAFAFVPMSIEISEDWQAIQSDMAMALADAKDELEASKFLKGVGHGSHEPQGLIAAGGATSIYTTASTATITVSDLYGLEAQLSERYLANATIVGSRQAFQKIRQLDTAGGANLWVQLGDGLPGRLLSYPTYVWSKYDSVASGSTVLTIGDFRYFAIADRVGMSVEFIPHLFGASNRLPTGQRGLYAYWRNSSQVLSPVTPSANSAFQSMKVL